LAAKEERRRRKKELKDRKKHQKSMTKKQDQDIDSSMKKSAKKRHRDSSSGNTIEIDSSPSERQLSLFQQLIKMNPIVAREINAAQKFAESKIIDRRTLMLKSFKVTDLIRWNGCSDSSLS
jgi:hypothetical protein